MASNLIVSRRFALICGFTLPLLSGCAKPSVDQPAVTPARQQVTLEVVNRSSSDMDILMTRLGDRRRLGLAPANVTTRFKLLPAQLVGAGQVVFEARPLLGLARPAQSEPTLLSPGDTITLEIPPPYGGLAPLPPWRRRPIPAPGSPRGIPPRPAPTRSHTP